jgi:pyridoxamine 5'-phosphate oxidase
MKPNDPIALFLRWFRAAARAGAPSPEAMVLATADRRGRPSARYVLLKEASARGFVFYTNANSRKGEEMRANRRVSLVFYWDVTGRQVRIEGAVKLLPAHEADAYWAERPVGSRFASAASDQSAPIASRRELLRKASALEAEYPDGDVPRPAHWKGYLVEPDAIEFWTRREPRMHERELYTLAGRPAAGGKGATKKKWKVEILQP